LLQERDNPNTLATKIFYQQVYGAKSPYGYTETGTEESTQAITREDMTGFYKEGYGPNNAALLVAGDFTQSQLKGLAEKWFGGWTGEAKASKPPQIEGELARKVVIVDKPGSPQSVLRIGEVGIQRNNPDFPRVAVMNEILGGLFSSRINLNLREAHGYTYGAFSAFAYRRGRGPFFIGSMVRTDVTAPAVKEVFNELDKMRGTAPSEAEVSMARQTLERGLTAQFETTAQTAATMRNIFTYDLPIDYYRNLPEKFAAVGTQDVQQMAEKYLSPDKMVVVVTGDRTKIEPGLKELSLGPTEALDTTGKAAATKE
jgi:zinc protease